MSKKSSNFAVEIKNQRFMKTKQFHETKIQLELNSLELELVKKSLYLYSVHAYNTARAAKKDGFNARYETYMFYSSVANELYMQLSNNNQ